MTTTPDPCCPACHGPTLGNALAMPDGRTTTRPLVTDANGSRSNHQPKLIGNSI